MHGASVLPAIDEWLLEHIAGRFLRMLPEFGQHRKAPTLPVFCVQYPHGPAAAARYGVPVEAMLGRIIHDAIWIDTGRNNTRDKIDAVQE